MPTTSTAASPTPSAEPVRRVGVVTHGKRELIGDALERLKSIGAAAGVEVTNESPDLVVVLGGDGTMLRAFQRYLGERVPVYGINFGRVGFLASSSPEGMEQDLARVFEGDYVVYELPTVVARADGEEVTAVNDVVATSATLGRMVELLWFIGDEEMGRVSCEDLSAPRPRARPRTTSRTVARC